MLQLEPIGLAIVEKYRDESKECIYVLSLELTTNRLIIIQYPQASHQIRTKLLPIKSIPHLKTNLRQLLEKNSFILF